MSSENSSEKYFVTYFHRKPRKGSNFSVESYFQTVRAHLPEYVSYKVHTLRYESNGLLKRLFSIFEVFFYRNRINHITGDVTFINLFLRRNSNALTVLDCGILSTSKGLRHFILKWIWFQIPIWRAGVVTVISEATKIELLKFVKCDPKKIHVIYVPISGKFEQKSIKEFDRNFPKLLQVGTKSNKNLSRLVKAISGIECVLDIVGPLNVEQTKELSENKIQYSNHVGISDEELINLYHECDIVTFVSTYEGFGMPIVEANIIGKPIITSNLLSMPEVAGNSAHLVDPYKVNEIKEGINKLISDESYRNTLISNGYENSKRFDPNVIAQQYIELYKNLSEN